MKEERGAGGGARAGEGGKTKEEVSRRVWKKI